MLPGDKVRAHCVAPNYSEVPVAAIKYMLIKPEQSLTSTVSDVTSMLVFRTTKSYQRREKSKENPSVARLQLQLDHTIVWPGGKQKPGWPALPKVKNLSIQATQAFKPAITCPKNILNGHVTCTKQGTTAATALAYTLSTRIR